MIHEPEVTMLLDFLSESYTTEKTQVHWVLDVIDDDGKQATGQLVTQDDKTFTIGMDPQVTFSKNNIRSIGLDTE